MLGNHADHFMLAQMRERVTAITPNAGGRSMTMPDRERAGSAHVTMKRGFQMPGPQRTVSSGYAPGAMMPGMGAQDMLPGMGEQDMLPGMGEQDMLPGMGEMTGTAKALTVAAVLGVLFYLRK